MFAGAQSSGAMHAMLGPARRWRCRSGAALRATGATRSAYKSATLQGEPQVVLARCARCQSRAKGAGVTRASVINNAIAADRHALQRPLALWGSRTEKPGVEQ
jgi:hypothetical protein